MQNLEPVILGIIQGITEFLPISSTAHLILTPWVFSWGTNNLPFDVSMHIGSVIAIFYYFRRDWYLIIRNFVFCIQKKSFEGDKYGLLGVNLIIATIPASIAGLLFEEYASGILRSPVIVASFLILFAIFLYLSDRKTTNQKSIDDLNLTDALVFGVFQALAIMPGVSRSGITITGGLLRNYRRDEAARFTFILGAPIITGAIILQLRHLSISDFQEQGILYGVISSMIVSLLVIKYLLRYLQSQTYTVFVIYRILLGIFIILYFNYR